MFASVGLRPRSLVDAGTADPQPYLVNLATDTTLTGALVYPLTVGITRVGCKGAKKAPVRWW